MKKYKIYIDTFSWAGDENVRHVIEQESELEKEDVLVDFINNHLKPLNNRHEVISVSNGNYQTVIPYEKITQFEIEEKK